MASIKSLKSLLSEVSSSNTSVTKSGKVIRATPRRKKISSIVYEENMTYKDRYLMSESVKII